MGLLDFLRGAQRPQQVILVNEGDPHVLDLDARSIYRTQPNVQAVVSFLADNVAELPLKCFLRVSDRERERVTDSPLALLLARPNADLTRFELLRNTTSDLLIYGRAWWMLAEDASAPSGWQLRLIPPTWVRVRSESGFAPQELLVSIGNGQWSEVPAGAMVCFSSYDPGHPAGCTSPVLVLRQVLAEQIEADRFRTQVWRRGGRMNAYITRPKDVRAWTEDQRTRFGESFRAGWTGDGGTEAGGVPVLEDGMELKRFDFSAREAEWAEAKQLSREDVAAVFHTNAAYIWRKNGLTYASAKDNARALYAETLAPILKMLEERINAFVLPALGGDPREYAEFDMRAKLRGSLEEQASVLQSAVGTPWMLVDEVRAMNNLPPIPGGDRLVSPLNLQQLDGPAETKAAPHECACEACSAEAPASFKAHPPDEVAERFEAAYRRFYERQRKSVLSAIGAKTGTKADGTPAWWDEERWVAELAADLDPLVREWSEAEALMVARALGLDPAYYDAEMTREYLAAVCRSRSIDANGKTLEDLLAVIASGGDPAEAFDAAEGKRSQTSGAALAAAVAGWSALESVRQARRAGHDVGRVTKTWVVTSGNPRPSHARMNGETVPYEANFSNGARWPGDVGALDAADVCNCKCEVEIRW